MKKIAQIGQCKLQLSSGVLALKILKKGADASEEASAQGEIP